MLELKNITKNYLSGENEVQALKGINIEFRDSEFVSILGPSGCGKTTMLNIIGGLDKYTSGDLIINGRSTKEFKDRDWDTYRNHSIGFVFQNYNLIAHQTVLGNVEMALTLSGISKSERRKKAEIALTRVGLKDQLKKRPNQMSGGQMQRVAIARAIVNDPDIILADEPTGALDSETSKQVMDILKEISKDKLVIMVTHNPELAQLYSSRIIQVLDGELINDSNPLKGKELQKTLEKYSIKGEKKEVIKKTSMNFMTALSLSFRNLLTKKARTILTAFAGSIGIIGIALILALSSGFQAYVDKLQADTLSSYPITISKTSLDYTSLREQMTSSTTINKYPDGNTIYVNDITTKLESIQHQNDITQEYLNSTIKTIDKELYYGINYSYDLNLNAYSPISNFYYPVSLSSMATTSSNSMMSMMSEIFGELATSVINSEELINSQYDILDKSTGGHLPENENQFVIVVDSYNQITNTTLQQLGLFEFANKESFTFEELKAKAKYKVFNNDELYRKVNDNYYQSKAFSSGVVDGIINANDVNADKAINLELVGIIRLNDVTAAGAINSSIGFHSDLIEKYMIDQKSSEVLQRQQALKAEYDASTDPNKTLINVLTGQPFVEIIDAATGLSITVEEQYKEVILNLGGVELPSKISIYPKDFKTKEVIKKHLNKFNDTVSEDTQKIYYSDVMELMVSSLNTMINSISYVLIAFTSISLVVSSIMIGIITYISVLERTKEIGILRAIGARKKDVSRVFNAETIIIGFTAGLLGVTITYLLSIPINFILSYLVEIDSLASLNPLHALALISISIFLTVISGLFPSRVAAKKDPVIALRTE